MNVKICCINSIEEAEMAIRYGATAIGLVGPMPSGPGVIDDDLIAQIASKVPPHIHTFLLTSETHSDGIIQHHQKVKTNTIQIVDALMGGSYSELRKYLPGVQLVQVIHVIGEESIEEARALSREVDALLLDSGKPQLEVKELGGTGRTHNWDISRQIVEAVEIPVYLAGGLKPENVVEAIERVKPFGVDLCSGVRTEGNLDAQKLGAFFESVLIVSKAD